MKKLLLSLVALMAVGVSAWADDSVTVPEVKARQGKSGVIEVYLNVDTKTTYASIAFDLQLPAGLTYDTMTFKQEVESGVFEDKEGPKAELSDIISSFSIASSYPDESDTQHIRVVAFGVGTTVNYGEDGNFLLLKIPFNVEGDFDIDTELEGTISELHLGKSDGTDVAFDPLTVTIKIVEDRIIFDENDEVLPDYASGEKGNIRMTRTMTAGRWSTVVLPFTITTNNLKTAFGDDAEYAYFSGWKAEGYDFDNDDLAPKSIEIQFTTKGVSPNVPGGIAFLVKPSKDVETFEFDNVTLTTTINDNHSTDKHKNTRDDAEGYGLVGVFRSTFTATTVPADGLFIRDNKFYYSTGETVLKGFRGWFDLGAVIGKDSDFGVKMSIDGVFTDVEGLQLVNTNGAVYNIGGQKMSNDVKRLQKGVYIIDGKKVAIK